MDISCAGGLAGYCRIMPSHTSNGLPDKIRSLLTQSSDLDIGQMEFINLDEVRAVCGENWGHWRERIFIAAESIIAKHTSQADLVIRCNAGFIIIFAELDPDDVRRVCDEIAASVRAFFLGSEEFSHLGLRMEASRVSANEFARKIQQARAEVLPTAATAHPEDELQDAHAATPQPVLQGRVPKVMVAFLPVWSATAEAVGTFFCVPYRRARDGRLIYGQSVLSADARPQDRLTLNIHIVRRAIEALNALDERGLKSAIGLSISYSVLAMARTRVPLMQELAAIPGHFKRQVLMRIDGTPVDAPAGQISELTRITSQYCGQVIMELPMRPPSFERYADARIHVVGLELVNGQDTLYQHRPEIERHVKDARRRNRALYLSNCQSRDVVREGAAHGLNFFTGPAIGAPLDMPSAPHKLSWDKIGQPRGAAAQAGRHQAKG